MIKTKTLIILCFTPFLSLAQESDLGNWFIYFGNKKINDKWNLHHEVQYRNYNAIGDLEQLLLRTGVGFNLTPNNNNLLLGYGFMQSENYLKDQSKISLSEHRIYQQFISKQSIARISLQHRYRFEQRWVENQSMRLRFRYFLAVNIPLNRDQMIEKTYYASFYNEIFLDTDELPFDRNRLYGGVGYKLNKQLKFEFGYMNQFFSNASRDQVNVIAAYNF